MKDKNLPQLIVGDVLLLSLCPLQGDMAVERNTTAQLPMLLLILTAFRGHCLSRLCCNFRLTGNRTGLHRIAPKLANASSAHMTALSLPLRLN
jgi:hypothetical protein